MAKPATIHVDVVYAEPERQVVRRVSVQAGATIADALRLSGLVEDIPGLRIDPAKIGVFGKLKATDTPLNDGDRVEIYRPLKADPKEVRRERAKGKAKA